MLARLLLALLLALSVPAFTVEATVGSSTARNEYTGTGTATVFPYTFRILDQSHIEVYVGGTLQTIASNYTVSGVGTATGGNITFLSAPANLATIIFIRNVPLTQLTDYVEGSRFPAESHEQALDKLTMIAQQQQEEIDRAPKLAATSTLDNITFPAPGASQFIRWNSAGTALEAATPATATGLATATLTSYTKATLPSSATAGTLARVSDDCRGVWMNNGTQWFPLHACVVNVMDFGAKPDDGVSDLTAIQAAVDVVEAAGGGTVVFPVGVYTIGAKITVQRSGVILQGTSAGGNSAGGTVIDCSATAITCIEMTDDDAGHTEPVIAKIRDLTIKGTEAANSIGVVIDGMQIWELKSVQIRNVAVGLKVGTTSVPPRGTHYGSVIDSRFYQITDGAGGGIGVHVVDRANAVGLVNTVIKNANMSIKAGSAGFPANTLSLINVTMEGGDTATDYIFGTNAAELNVIDLSIIGSRVEDPDGNNAALLIGADADNVFLAATLFSGTSEVSFDVGFVGSYCEFRAVANRHYCRNSSFLYERASAGVPTFRSRVVGDANDRHRTLASGMQEGGDGTAAVDTSWGRVAANTFGLAAGDSVNLNTNDNTFVLGHRAFTTTAGSITLTSGNVFTITAAGAIAVTDITPKTNGHFVIFICGDTNTTFNDAGNLLLNGNFVCTTIGDTLHIVTAGSTWSEVSRSNN